MPEPTVRRRDPYVALTKEQLRERFFSRFYDPAFDEVAVELEKVFERAWGGYIKYRKSPRQQCRRLPLPYHWHHRRARHRQALGYRCGGWLAAKAGLATLPESVSWRHVVGTAFLAGIGFTMALFISGLAFPGTDLESEAKLGILLASLLAATAGIFVLLTTQRQAEPASA